ncbi:hypothetical protein E2C01_045151 [Portunus trituberculatus]|uniref:Uncharacterized protein n=1 Tax=Portunus trituberculatus TaxID=210409 RepID=A0A5B7G0H0_PORTR|nr:hypothetical protein [Portunus trituberculatus]
MGTGRRWAAWWRVAYSGDRQGKGSLQGALGGALLTWCVLRGSFQMSSGIFLCVGCCSLTECVPVSLSAAQPPTMPHRLMATPSSPRPTGEHVIHSFSYQSWDQDRERAARPQLPAAAAAVASSVRHKQCHHRPEEELLVLCKT